MTEDNQEFKPLSELMPLVDGERFVDCFGKSHTVEGDCLVSFIGHRTLVADSLTFIFDPLGRNTPELDLSNPDKVALADMEPEQIKAIMNAAEANLEFFHRHSKEWRKMASPRIFPSLAYRVPPKVTPMSVDWDQVGDSINYIAVDKDGEVFGFRNRPYGVTDAWCSGDRFYWRISGFFASFKRGNIPWDQSLIERPKEQ